MCAINWAVAWGRRTAEPNDRSSLVCSTRAAHGATKNARRAASDACRNKIHCLPAGICRSELEDRQYTDTLFVAPSRSTQERRKTLLCCFPGEYSASCSWVRQNLAQLCLIAKIHLYVLFQKKGIRCVAICLTCDCCMLKVVAFLVTDLWACVCVCVCLSDVVPHVVLGLPVFYCLVQQDSMLPPTSDPMMICSTGRLFGVFIAIRIALSY